MKTIFIVFILLFSKSLYAFDNQIFDTPSNVFSDVPLKTKEIDSILNLFDEKEPEWGGCMFERMPEFEGGEEALLKFVTDSTKYPKDAFEKKIQGKVFIRFIVCKDGSIKNPTVVKPLLKSFDEEALRITRLLPKFKPAKQNGQVVDVWYVVPFEFKSSK